MTKPRHLLFLSCVILSTAVASAYDFGCQYVWREPSKENDLVVCAKTLPTDNAGVLIPPLIPAVFCVFLFVLFPVIFFGRCCGACGSTEMRPGADCCCDGEEWDDLPVDEKATVYPARHVSCIKLACLGVVLLCIVPIVLMPIGGQYGSKFWDDFYGSATADVFDWAENLKDSFVAELTDDTGAYPYPLTSDTFNTLQDFIDNGRSKLDDVNKMIKDNFEVVNKCITAVSFVPLVLTSFLIMFILLNVRKVLPAILMWVYFLVAIVFSLLSVVAMVLGVFFVLVDGEVELQNWKAPGIFQWYAVPTCEGEAMFSDLKADFQDANVEQARLMCRSFTDLCDDLAFSITPVAGVSSSKPFYCTLTSANINTTCTSIVYSAMLINSTEIKAGAAPLVCPSTGNCTVGDCPSTCEPGSVRNATVEIQSEYKTAERVLEALDRAFLYADCDVLLTQALKPLNSLDGAAWAAFLAAAGTGFGALFLMFGIILLCKGQKLFFGKPGKGSKVSPSDSYKGTSKMPAGDLE